MGEQRDLAVAGTPRFATLTAHRLWLIDNARALFDFFQRPSFNPAGGFFSLDENARPLPPKPGHKGANRQVHETTRMVHCLRHRASARAAGRRPHRRPWDGVPVGAHARRRARRLFLGRGRREADRPDEAGLRPRLRPARRLVRDVRGPSRRAASARGRDAGHRGKVLGQGGRRDHGRIQSPTGRRWGLIAARTPTCISPKR